RWTNELTIVACELHRAIAAKGKPPTFRQFARFAAPAANHWFNGDVASPVHSHRRESTRNPTTSRSPTYRSTRLHKRRLHRPRWRTIR
ncbi:MAG: hypothetical protein ACREXR_14700, partial [Gammaproteobacteria bacterium]